MALIVRVVDDIRYGLRDLEAALRLLRDTK